MKTRFNRLKREMVGVSGVCLLFLAYLCFEAARPAVAAKGAVMDSVVYFLTDGFTSHHLLIAALVFVILGCLFLAIVVVTTGKDGRVVFPWNKADSNEDLRSEKREEPE
jgi:hypothetical protein